MHRPYVFIRPSRAHQEGAFVLPDGQPLGGAAVPLSTGWRVRVPSPRWPGLRRCWGRARVFGDPGPTIHV
eukprot:6321638-Alexandrium_andersonii.AAC.1